MYHDAILSLFYGLTSMAICALFVAVLRWIKRALFQIGKKMIHDNPLLF